MLKIKQINQKIKIYYKKTKHLIPMEKKGKKKNFSKFEIIINLFQILNIKGNSILFINDRKIKIIILDATTKKRVKNFFQVYTI